MRVRLPFAGSFILLVIFVGYNSLSSYQSGTRVNEKILHSIIFFILTTSFYWILDTSRRRSFNFTLLVCTGVLGIGSEFLEGFLPNSHPFNLNEVLANILGSLLALGMNSWYHTRMLERKRLAKQYQTVPEDDDIELGSSAGTQEIDLTLRTPGVPLLERTIDKQEDIEFSNTAESLRRPSAQSLIAGDGSDAKKRAD
ncbi:BgTH12-02693 [Blumeria graminis f. sp. triticale]|uniref:Bgt-2508 n=3 Tax=Blumeria graminis TaxID=34373 RepID=A0A381LDM0_BLUGR|nr:hypothetical protein BGT96224_2508 [Blumeria graminis f. sp. tritici 96224]CAD6503022.1 BgTH12-02693 [Blumeria graminis f. sp. triticale]VDB88960.1 Bgt-2508 [Blumeria graminis f. sp. tritici]